MMMKLKMACWNIFEIKKKCNPISGDDSQIKRNTEEVF